MDNQERLVWTHFSCYNLLTYQGFTQNQTLTVAVAVQLRCHRAVVPNNFSLKPPLPVSKSSQPPPAPIFDQNMKQRDFINLIHTNIILVNSQHQSKQGCAHALRSLAPPCGGCRPQFGNHCIENAHLRLQPSELANFRFSVKLTYGIKCNSSSRLSKCYWTELSK